MTADEITKRIASEFRCFGQGSAADDGNNLIAAATADRPPIFALGVDVQAVVERVIALSRLGAKRRRTT